MWLYGMRNGSRGVTAASRRAASDIHHLGLTLPRHIGQCRVILICVRNGTRAATLDAVNVRLVDAWYG